MAEATLSKVKIQPLGDRVLVKPAEAKETKRGGIIIPDSAKEKPQEGIIAACGTENNSGYVTFTNNKTVDRTLHVRVYSSKGSATAEATDGVTWPQQRIRGYAEACASPALSAGVLTLDLSQRNNFRVARNANITSIVLAGVPTMPASTSAMQQAFSFTLMLDSTGTFTVALPAAWHPFGTAPTFSTTGKSDMLTVWTTDGTTWYYTAAVGATT